MSGTPVLEATTVTVADAVGTLTLNRPQQRNALSAAMLRDLILGLEWLQGATEVRVVVLTGAGEHAFCAGADLGSFQGGAGPLEQHRDRGAFVRLFQLLQDLGKPILGRVNGHALAGGFGLACACDLLVAVEEATFGTPEINVGVWPMMIQAVLARNLPRKVLLEMEMLGGRWTAGQLAALGVINRVVSRAQLDTATAELAWQLAAKSPLVMAMGRNSFYRQQDLEFRSALEYLQGQLSLVSLSEDTREGVTAFLEKREPEFRGR